MSKIWKKDQGNKSEPFTKEKMNVAGQSFKEKPILSIPVSGKGKDGDAPYTEDVNSAIEIAQKVLGVQPEPNPKDQKKKQSGSFVSILYGFFNFPVDVPLDISPELLFTADQENLIFKDRLKRIKSNYLDVINVSWI
jgi:hypothetical protein